MTTSAARSSITPTTTNIEVLRAAAAAQADAGRLEAMPRTAPGRPLGEIDAVILCGGLGTRLRSVIADRPKPLALVGGRPFLDRLVDDLLAQGIHRIVFSVGHLKEQIIERYRARRDAETVFAEEDTPLGTGGAVRLALTHTRADPILVINGDSHCQVDFEAMLQRHRAQRAAATMVLTALEGQVDGGLVRLDGQGRIVSFAEKAAPSEGFINAGIYLLQRDVIASMAMSPPVSLERDVFPMLVKVKPCFGFVVQGPLIDIGTPERYRAANVLSERHRE